MTSHRRRLSLEMDALLNDHDPSASVVPGPSAARLDHSDPLQAAVQNLDRIRDILSLCHHPVPEWRALELFNDLTRFALRATLKLHRPVAPDDNPFYSIGAVIVKCPCEVLTNILRFLTWTACQNLKTAAVASTTTQTTKAHVEEKMNQVIEERWNPALYLGQHFRDGHDLGAGAVLLKTMTDAGMILSGSRALEYFLGGMVQSSSDWDFYVPAVARNVFTAMAGLKQVGVTFETTLSRFRQKIAAKKADVILTFPDLVALQIEKANDDEEQLVESLLPRAKLRTMTDWMARQRYARLQLIDGGYVLKEKPDDPPGLDNSNYNPATLSDVHIEDIHDADSYDIGMTIIHGFTQGNVDQGVPSTKVQLIVDHRGSYWREGDLVLLQGACVVYPTILRFHSSVVQCFLTGFAAVHLYHTLLDQNTSVAWNLARESERVQRTSELAIVKYKARGIRFDEVACRDRQYRRLGDNADSLVLRFRDLGVAQLDTPRVDWEYRVMVDLSWVESARQISHVDGPDQKAVQKILKRMPGTEDGPTGLAFFWRCLRTDTREGGNQAWNQISKEPITDVELKGMVHFAARYSAAYASLYNMVDDELFRQAMLLQAMRDGTTFLVHN